MQARYGDLPQGRQGAGGAAWRDPAEAPAPRQDAARTAGRDPARRRQHVGARRRPVHRREADRSVSRGFRTQPGWVLIAALFLSAAGTARADDAAPPPATETMPTDGYCEFVNGTAESNADFFYAPNVIGTIGYVKE